ncbi:hypothetical protein [Nafulsella turpanensis]|uniref:hypothetical protein n=1 Tax=Nafulsella turpanensis TaxID=1265690 RepID=UPI00034B31B4|nr:hypothetical protein [Nafulsella turpanensis]
MRKFSLSAILLVSLWACETHQAPSAEAYQAALDSTRVAKPEISQEVITDILQQIPSPLEISVLLKESGTAYNQAMLNDPQKTSVYNTNYEKAINLGIYGTDLGYTNIYEQNQDAIFYLNSIKELADELSIGQFFDFGTIKRLATNSSNLDSLLYLTTKNFNNINAFLQDQKRSNLSILILTGGWLEALHITCQVAEKNPNNKVLIERIGEQKMIMDNIMLLLSFYSESNSSMAAYMKELQPLADAFGKVEIVHTYAEPTFVEVDGMLVVQDNSTSEVIMSPENLKEIASHTQSIRKNIIK